MFSRQLGVITRAQALECGLTPRQIGRRLTDGTWRSVQRAVYAHAAAPLTHEGELLAAVLALGTGAAASHRSAVGIWGLYGYEARLVEASTPARHPSSLRAGIAHSARDLTTRDVTTRRALPVTTPARTLVDLGAVMPAAFVTRCVEEWLADRKVSIAQLERAIRDHRGRGRAGVGVLRRVLADRALGDRVADSGVEALLARVLRERGLPPPVHHHRVVRHGIVVAELDYAYPGERIAIEVDGYGVHLRSRAIFERDRERQNELEIEGWRFLRFTSTKLARAPDLVAEQAARMLAT